MSSGESWRDIATNKDLIPPKDVKKKLKGSSKNGKLNRISEHSLKELKQSKDGQYDLTVLRDVFDGVDNDAYNRNTYN